MMHQIDQQYHELTDDLTIHIDILSNFPSNCSIDLRTINADVEQLFLTCR